MAEAASSESRGVAGVTATKGLFLIFTLLCLVGFATIWSYKEKRKENLQQQQQNLQQQMESLKKKIKEKIQKNQQQLDRFEANHKSRVKEFSDAINGHLRLMDPMTTLAKKASEKLPDDFTPLERFLQSLKGLLGTIKIYVEENNEIKEIEKGKQQMREDKKTFELLEKQHSEL